MLLYDLVRKDTIILIIVDIISFIVVDKIELIMSSE